MYAYCLLQSYIILVSILLIRNIPALHFRHVHACDAFTLTTCWCALKSIPAIGAHFPVTLTTTIAANYLKESLWCCWLNHSNRYKTRGRSCPAPNLGGDIVATPSLHLMISSIVMKGGCIKRWSQLLWRHILCRSSHLLQELRHLCRIKT